MPPCLKRNSSIGKRYGNHCDVAYYACDSTRAAAFIYVFGSLTVIRRGGNEVAPDLTGMRIVMVIRHGTMMVISGHRQLRREIDPGKRNRRVKNEHCRDETDRQAIHSI